MMKKLLFSLMGAIPVLMMSAFAVSIDLDLLGGGLSILDALFLIGTGLALIGVLFLCIAFLKPVKQEPEEEADVEDFLPETDLETEIEDTETPEEEKEAVEAEPVAEPEVLTAEATEEEVVAEKPETAEEEEEDVLLEAEADAENQEAVEEVTEEKVYPTLTLTGTNSGEFKILPLKKSVTLGRRLENDLIFSDTTISGVHCEITVEDDKVYLADKNSTNGTFLNGERITEKTEIHKGDILSLGQMELRIGI